MSRRNRPFEQRYYYKEMDQSDRAHLKPAISNAGSRQFDLFKAPDMQVEQSSLLFLLGHILIEIMQSSGAQTQLFQHLQNVVMMVWSKKGTLTQLL